MPDRRRALRLLVIAVAAVVGAGLVAAPAQAGKSQDQSKVKKKVNDALAALYKAQPSAKKAVQGAYGYAVFSNFGMKILVAGSGTGKGIAFNNKTSKQTYMKMVEVQAGLGIGVKKFNLIWVFNTKAAFDQFVNSGWTVGGQANASAKYDDKGGAFQGAVAVAPDVWLYQMTDKGLAAELTVKGTKYYKDDDLN